MDAYTQSGPPKLMMSSIAYDGNDGGVGCFASSELQDDKSLIDIETNDQVLRRSDLASMAARMGAIADRPAHGESINRLHCSDAGKDALLEKTRMAASEFRKILTQHDVTATQLSKLEVERTEMTRQMEELARKLAVAQAETNAMQQNQAEEHLRMSQSLRREKEAVGVERRELVEETARLQDALRSSQQNLFTVIGQSELREKTLREEISKVRKELENSKKELENSARENMKEVVRLEEEAMNSRNAAKEARRGQQTLQDQCEELRSYAPLLLHRRQHGGASRV
jgi:chromosome segregation ATPase